MPPSQKITKEIILEAGYTLLNDEGLENLNARNIAKRLKCSTQPIFSQFENMEELRKAVHNYACEKFEADILQGELAKNFIRNSYLQVIHLAKEKPNVFRMIFLSKYCAGNDFLTDRMNYVCNQKLGEELQKEYKLSDEETLNIVERISLLVHGMATLICTTDFQYSEEQIIAIIETTIEDMKNGFKSI